MHAIRYQTAEKGLHSSLSIHQPSHWLRHFGKYIDLNHPHADDRGELVSRGNRLDVDKVVVSDSTFE